MIKNFSETEIARFLGDFPEILGNFAWKNFIKRLQFAANQRLVCVPVAPSAEINLEKFLRRCSLMSTSGQMA
jgi:hypothetical protein